MDSVLEHIINPIEALNELKRILKPGGILFFIVPNEDSLINSFIKIFGVSSKISNREQRKLKIVNTLS